MTIKLKTLKEKDGIIYMAKKSDFKSLVDASDAFETKNGKAFRASFSGFMGGKADSNTPATVREAGKQYVVSGFTGLVNSADLINEKLGTKFEDDKEFNNLTANVSLFTYTKEEAEAIAPMMKVGARAMGTVVVGTHEYNGNLLLDIRFESPRFMEPTSNVASSPAKADDKDIPF